MQLRNGTDRSKVGDQWIKKKVKSSKIIWLTE